MTEQHFHIELPLILPDAPDAKDACVGRLQSLIVGRRGVTFGHVTTANGHSVLCVHFDPRVISLAEVDRLVRAAGAEMTARYGHAVLPIRAVAGEDSGRRIEDAMAALDGVVQASANLAAQRLRIEFDRTRVDLDRIRSAVRDLGFGVEQPIEPAVPAPEAPAGWYLRNRELAWSLMAGVLLALAATTSRWGWLSREFVLALYLGSYVCGSWDLVRHAWGSLRQGRFTFDIDLLMLIAAIGAAMLGQWAEGALLLFLFSVAHALEHYALGRARGAIRALAELTPPIARVVRGGRDVETPVEQIAIGDVVRVRPGERIPVDGTISSGQSAVNQAPVTGESVPVDKAAGDEVFAGTVNGEGALEIATTRAVGDRTLDRVIKLVEEAETHKAPTQQMTERFERVFVPVVLAAAVLVIVVPPLAGFWTWSTSFYRAMALLVGASPCALALGTPAAVLAGIAQAARNGVLIKGGAHLENFGRLRALAFDKTGTLTVGRPALTEALPAEGVDVKVLLSIAAAVERQSQHPLARAVVHAAEAAHVSIPSAGPLQSVTARGVRATVQDAMVEIGSLRLWDDQGVQIPDAIRRDVEQLQRAGNSIMVVRHGARWLGVLGLADQPRANARAVLDRLRSLQLRPLVMLTGDNRGVADAIARRLGVDEVRAELLPEEKVTAIKQLLNEHGAVAMVGDGVNDAPALAHATVGVAMGGAGTAVALETADVALMGDDLSRLPFAIGLSRRATQVIRQNLVLALTAIVLLVGATVTGLAGIGVAVAFHEGSTLVVIANALRLLVYHEDPAVGTTGTLSARQRTAMDSAAATPLRG